MCPVVAATSQRGETYCDAKADRRAKIGEEQGTGQEVHVYMRSTPYDPLPTLGIVCMDY